MEARFEAHVDRSGTCHVWTGATNKKGYGKYAVGASTRRWVLAHRYVFEREVRPLKPGEIVRHSCDNPPCVRRKHLLVGAVKQNNEEAWQRTRGGLPVDALDQFAQLREQGLTWVQVAAELGVHEMTVHRRKRRAIEEGEWP